MSASPIKSSNTTSTATSLLAVQRFLDEENDDLDDNNAAEPNAGAALGAEPLSDAVIGLRGWGARRIYPLRGPLDSRRPVATGTRASTNDLQLSRASLAMAASSVELMYEGQSWRIKDWDGIAGLKLDGKPAREVSLLAGTEVTIAGRTYIAESPRSIALRNFCSRLIGWGDDRIAVVDQALRAIRLASSGRAALVLCGSGDLVPAAHTIHRHTFGADAPFIVADPRRKNTPATVRAPANCVWGMEGFRTAHRGTLCVRTRRPPQDFEDVLSAFRTPESGVQLIACANDSGKPARGAFALGAAQIDILSLETRRAELPRIVSEYVEDAIDHLHAPVDCLTPEDIEWISTHAALSEELTIPDIEKAALRTVAIKMTGDLSQAARLLGMARVSLERWLQRRNDDDRGVCISIQA